MATHKIVLELPEDPTSPSLARLIGRNLLQHRAATPQDIDDIEILVGELCTNVTRHAVSSEGFFRITLEHDGDRVTLIVEDHGLGLDMQHVPPVGALRSDGIEGERHGGFGLPLIHYLADAVRFETRTPRGTSAYVEKS